MPRIIKSEPVVEKRAVCPHCEASAMASSIPVALKFSDEPFHVEPFERCDVWAVTPALDPEPPVRTMAGRYVVTHVPSGLQVCSYGVPLDDAFALYRLLTARFPSFEKRATFGQKPESVELVRATHSEWREEKERPW